MTVRYRTGHHYQYTLRPSSRSTRWQVRTRRLRVPEAAKRQLNEYVALVVVSYLLLAITCQSAAFDDLGVRHSC
jgi:hypothetical protein